MEALILFPVIALPFAILCGIALAFDFNGSAI
jgi:hypothetical protein